MDDQQKFDPFHVLAASFALSSLGGLAALLRSQKKLTARTIVSAVLWSGLTGLLIALTWFNYFNSQGNIYFLLAVSGLAGIGGTTVVDLLMQIFKSGGINIVISPKEHEDKD